MIQDNSALEKRIRLDLKDREYSFEGVYSCSIEIRVQDGCIRISGQDFGSVCKSMTGDSEYEFFYSLDEENTKRFLLVLRERYGLKKSLRQVLKEEFGDYWNSDSFRDICMFNGIQYQFYSC